MSFALLVVSICLGLVIYVIQRSRRRARERRWRQESWRADGQMRIRDLKELKGEGEEE